MVDFLNTRNFTPSTQPADGYDLFVDRTDGVDIILSVDINELKNSVINVQKSLKVGDTKAGFWQLNHQASTPATPSGSGNIRIYAQSDVLKWVDSTGAVNSIAAGVSSLSAIGSSPNANGATITGTTLNLEPASASFGGIVTTGTQTLAGAKTFSGETTFSSQIRVSNGSASEPSIVFSSDDDATGTGLYRIGVDNLGFSANGVGIGEYSSTGAWTLGTTTGSGVTHTLQSGASTILEITGTTNASPELKLTGTGTGNPRIKSGSAGDFRFINSSDAIIGSFSSTGAWTLGPASTDLSHILNVGTSSRAIKFGPGSSSPGFAIDNAASGAACSLLQASGTSQFTFNTSVFQFATNSYANISNTTNLGSSGGTVVGSCSSTGAWTLGPSSGSTLTHTVDSGAATRFAISSRSGANSILQFNINGVKQRTVEVAATAQMNFLNSSDNAVGSCTDAGAWTLGPTSTNLTHQVNGDIFVLNTPAGQACSLHFKEATTLKWSLYNDAADDSLNFSNGSAIVGRVLSDGQWRLGPSSPSIQTYHVINCYTAAGAEGVVINNTNTTASGTTLRISKSLSSGSASMIDFVTNALVGNIVSSTVGTTYNSISDARLKTNPEAFNGLDLVSQMQPKRYERLSNPGPKEIGFYAQELHQVFPQAVNVGGDVDTAPWGIDYGKLTPVLVKAIQELKAELDEAKARIAALEAQ